MTTIKMAVIPGDGIGKEVMQEALKVVKCVQERDSSLQITTMVFPWSSDYYLAHGRMMPEDALETLQKYDAILFGAIGDAFAYQMMSRYGNSLCRFGKISSSM